MLHTVVDPSTELFRGEGPPSHFIQLPAKDEVGVQIDGLHVGHVTQLPALVLLGWWWGRLGRRGSPIERSFNLGLLAALGSLLLGGSFLLQWQFLGVLPEGGLQLLLAQALITALLAPLICSLLLLRWRKLLSARG